MKRLIAILSLMMIGHFSMAQQRYYEEIRSQGEGAKFIHHSSDDLLYSAKYMTLEVNVLATGIAEAQIEASVEGRGYQNFGEWSVFAYASEFYAGVLEAGDFDGTFGCGYEVRAGTLYIDGYITAPPGEMAGAEIEIYYRFDSMCP
ncbi:hypothetical protein GFS24_22655 [Chitinophaga sp. SYP-B3965]|uniref:hypothetical protein n=1 Tax=Chitinophaga sp. SYP-B3965 TaxID=2663120 RepID=UPI001299D068|nr:hypothetical protein [Chitinophaga sp. SYP-B3965]MRG47939.1 hypothetical protein [Chitinophaga sp. SYP-B3965]